MDMKAGITTTTTITTTKLRSEVIRSTRIIMIILTIILFMSMGTRNFRPLVNLSKDEGRDRDMVMVMDKDTTVKLRARLWRMSDRSLLHAPHCQMHNNNNSSSSSSNNSPDNHNSSKISLTTRASSRGLTLKLSLAVRTMEEDGRGSLLRYHRQR